MKKVPETDVREESGRQHEPSDKPHFELVHTWRGPEERGVRVAGARYRAEDGTLVEKIVETHSSVDRAHVAMQKIVHEAISILEQGHKMRGDDRVGGRAVIQIRKHRAHAMPFLVVWTDGRNLFVLESVSLDHALALEKDVYLNSD